MKNVIRLFMSIMVVVMLSGCGEGSILIVWGEPLILSLAVADVSASSTTLSLTSNFNCVDCPVYRNDILYTHVSTQSFVPTLFVVSNSPACYKAGDFLSPMGWVWSNEVCI